MARKILVLAFDNVQVLDVTGPTEAFSLAARETGAGDYEIEMVAPTAGPVRASSGLILQPHGSIEAFSGPVDTLLIPGGLGVREARRDERVTDWIRSVAARSRRVVSICTGAFLLAEAGLLDGRRATTHWNACAALKRRYSSIEVQDDPIFVRDGNVYTSAGITAGIDLALSLVEEDLGSRVALQVARTLVLFVRRPGGQSQFSAGLAGQVAERQTLRELQDWMFDNVEADLSVAALAERSFMSQRNFARVFGREVGATPAVYVESLRVERARVLLETTALTLEEVAQRCGFGTVETLRRAFARRLHVPPREYRRHFTPAPDREASMASVIPISRSAS